MDIKLYTPKDRKDAHSQAGRQQTSAAERNVRGPRKYVYAHSSFVRLTYIHLHLVLGLIVNKFFPTVHGSQHSPSVSGESSTVLSSSSPSPTSSSFPVIPPQPPPIRQPIVDVAVTLVVHGIDPYCGTQTPAFTLDLDENMFSESSYPNARSFTYRAELRSAHCLSQSPPEIKFSAQSLQDLNRHYRSICSVYYDNDLVYTDADSSKLLHVVSFDALSQYALYGLELVPDFWAQILSNLEGAIYILDLQLLV